MRRRMKERTKSQLHLFTSKLQGTEQSSVDRRVNVLAMEYEKKEGIVGVFWYFPWVTNVEHARSRIEKYISASGRTGSLGGAPHISAVLYTGILH